MQSARSPRGIFWWYETDEMIATVMEIMATEDETGEDPHSD
jgi:hypothetical protein